MKGKDFIKRYLIKKQNNRYEREVRRQFEVYDTWIRQAESVRRAKEQKTAEAALASESEFVWLPARPGSLAQEAKQQAAAYFAKHSRCMIVYADEDVREPESGVRTNPWFKPDWSPDTFMTYDYFGNAAAVRTSLLADLGYAPEDITWENRRQVLYSCVKACGGFLPACRTIGHIGRILFHADSEEEGQKPYFPANQKILEAEDRERDETDNLRAPRKISVIIPSKDNVSVLKQCINSVIKTAEGEALEFIIVDNGSCQDTVEKIEKLKENLTNTNSDTKDNCVPEYEIMYIYCPMEFNFSKMCNLGAKTAGGDFLLFLNDDTQAVSTGWLERMAEKAEQPYAGAAGMKLLYPDNDRIQHAGIVNLPMGPVHKLQFLSDTEEYYFGRNRGIHNVLAVTAACLMIKKERFFEAGGFCEELKVAFNDVALCFRLYEMGYHNLVINTGFLYHHESLSRGNDESEEKWKRLMEERNRLYELFPALRGKDPYYSPFLNRNGLDTRILPGNEDIRTKAEPTALVRLEKEPGYDRRDECLLIRLERAEENNIQGYAVVLGSNNACYEKKLLLKREPEDGKENAEDTGYGYEMKLSPVFRSDLKENMKDQINVALCGFHVCPERKPAPGIYRIGVLARDRISGRKILNFSSRTIRVSETKSTENGYPV